MATIDELIAQLNLRADGLETTSSAKSGTYAELRALGASSVEPLMRALPGADPEAAPSIMSLLGQAGDPRAIGPILGRLDDPDGNVRRSALTALGLFSMSDLSAGGVARTLASREEDSDPSVGEAAAALRARLGLPAPDAPWYAVAAGWEPLARAFIWRELGKPDPNFRSLADQLVAYSAAERHAVWIGIGQEAPSRMGRTRAYVEALHNDPDPTSVAWGWLEGDYDLMGRVEHVIGPDDAHTLDTVEAVRDRLGSIVDVGGADRPGADTDTTEKAQPAAGEPTAEQVQPVAEEPAAEEPVPERSQLAAEQAGPAAQSPEGPSWSPTHFVPAGGLPAWDYPDPSRQPMVVLNPGLGLVVDAVAGDWARVRAVNGWQGWVDGRRLITPA
ncbi:MAG TPA: hypothetical protein VGE81_02765 [Candidatus Limnocylindrales bacterium]|jgi:hypothetical protein